MATVAGYIDVEAPVGTDELRRIQRMNNNALIIRLHFTINHLSRWLSPIHDRNRLERSLHFGEPTVKELLIGMREEEHRIFPMMHMITVENDPDLDRLPPYEPPDDRPEIDARRAPIEILAQFRRLRQSTCSLLRSMPDDAWRRVGTSRRGYNASLRSLAEELAEHDYRYLRAIDQALDRTGAREGLAEIQKTHLDELLRLVPEEIIL
ncbi:MAG: hypothetical protein WBA63_16705 [Thermomicrobiales bacterium]